MPFSAYKPFAVNDASIHQWIMVKYLIFFQVRTFVETTKDFLHTKYLLIFQSSRPWKYCKNFVGGKLFIKMILRNRIVVERVDQTNSFCRAFQLNLFRPVFLRYMESDQGCTFLVASLTSIQEIVIMIPHVLFQHCTPQLFRSPVHPR